MASSSSSHHKRAGESPVVDKQEGRDLHEEDATRARGIDKREKRIDGASSSFCFSPPFNIDEESSEKLRSQAEMWESYLARYIGQEAVVGYPLECLVQVNPCEEESNGAVFCE